MIVKWFLEGITSFFVTILDALPDLAVPDWFTSSGTWLDVIFEHLGSMGVWMNMPLVISVGTVMLIALLISAAVKIARIVISLLSAGGGSAA